MQYILVLISLLIISSYSKNPNENSKKDKTAKFQRRAINTWVSNLTDTIDVPVVRNQKLFDVYVQRLSDIFTSSHARVNFVLIGAYDGTQDNTIHDEFLINPNWNGVFVEPITNNYLDLNIFLGKNNVADRSYTSQNAIASACETTNITIKVDSLVKSNNNQNSQNWLQRQIDSVIKTANEVVQSSK